MLNLPRQHEFSYTTSDTLYLCACFTTRDIRAPDVMTFCLLMETLAVERLFGDGGVYRCLDSENERVLVNY